MSPPFLIEDESLESGEDVVSLATRFLKKASYEEPDRSDYSIMSVAVMTLGLIMIIELLRHRLDHAAMGKPFFTAVLQGVYAERKWNTLPRASVTIPRRYCTPSLAPSQCLTLALVRQFPHSV
jgi:hypothetical protein